MSKGTIVFDLDGTLVDSVPDLAGSLDTLMEERGWRRSVSKPRAG